MEKKRNEMPSVCSYTLVVVTSLYGLKRKDEILCFA